MNEFRVESMTCGHCARTIAEAIRGVDPDAQIEVDLLGRKVKVEGRASRQALTAALANAGHLAA